MLEKNSYSFIRYSVLIAALSITQSLFPVHDIEAARTFMVHQLIKRNPIVINEFNQLCEQYDRSVIMFFDTANTDSLLVHIHRMQQELMLLKNTYEDPRFKSVAKVLREYYEHIVEMVGILQQYVGSKNSVALALKVRKFKFLLPTSVQNRGNVSLFFSIHHRLMCLETHKKPTQIFH